MKVTYQGVYPVLLDTKGFRGLVNPSDSIDMDDEIYAAEFKNNPKWGITEAKKPKKTVEKGDN
jgi:hypothetical protein